MALFALGLDYRSAPIEVREQFAFGPEAARPALIALREAAGADEALLLSTCNRTEIYLRADSAAALERAGRWLRGRAGLDPAPHLYELAGDAVARHAFRVASGLDSMVVGETQILGQMKRAVRAAAEAGTLGGSLDRLFQQAFCAAKEVRARTGVGELSVSASAAAVALCRGVFGDLSRVRMLFVGAGEMIERAAAHFMAQAPLEAAIANRTLERGEAIAARFGARALRLADLPASLHRFDVVVSCTASTLPILGKGMLERALRARRHRPMFLVDLAVPRDIEPEVAELDDVFLHTLDSLGAVTQENSRRRGQEVEKADVIIVERVAAFAEWLRARDAVPLIRRIRSRADHAREIELARARKRLARGEDPMAVVEALAASLANKLLHPPMHALNHADAGERERLVASLETLYRPEPALPTPASRPHAAA